MIKTIPYNVTTSMTSEGYSCMPPVSEQKLCVRMRQRVPVPMSTTDILRDITYC